MSAYQRIEIGDLNAATSDLAIAAESVIRQFLDRTLPATTPKWARNMAARLNMSELLSKWLKFGFPAISQLARFKEIKTLIDVRNGIMHRGADPRVNPRF